MSGLDTREIDNDWMTGQSISAFSMSCTISFGILCSVGVLGRGSGLYDGSGLSADPDSGNVFGAV